MAYITKIDTDGTATGTLENGRVALDRVTGKVYVGDGITAGKDEALAINAKHSDTATTTTGNAGTATTLVGLTATVTELNKIDGYTGTATELNWVDTLHATGVTSTEFDHLDGVSSNIQTQLDTLDNNILAMSIALG